MIKTRLAFFSFVLLVTSSSFAQFSKGDKLLGGSINFHGNSNSLTTPGVNYGSNGFATNLSPRFGFFYKENKMVGISLSGNYSRGKSTIAANVEEKNTTYGAGIGLFARNYKAFSSQFGWFLDYAGGVNHFSNKSERTLTPDFKTKQLSFNFGIAPGLYYKVSPKALIDASFGGIGANYSTHYNGNNKSRNFSAGLNFPSNFSFGIQFLLTARTKK
jgi:hypothetical protein